MSTYTIGLISDTHGCLPQAVRDVFKGVDAIVHAGDIGSKSIIQTLDAIAPVTAVRGNCDYGLMAAFFEDIEFLTINLWEIAVTHKFSQAKAMQGETYKGIVVFGHTHVPETFKLYDTLYINPGSPVKPREVNVGSVAILTLNDDADPEVKYYRIENEE